MKWKIIYGLLALTLAGGMVVSPAPAVVRAEASSVSNVWVELSDDDAVNTANATLEYIIHFTTTALTGGVVNPATSVSAAKVKIYTSAEPKYAKADTGYVVTADSSTPTMAGFTITPLQPSLD